MILHLMTACSRPKEAAARFLVGCGVSGALSPLSSCPSPRAPRGAARRFRLSAAACSAAASLKRTRVARVDVALNGQTTHTHTHSRDRQTGRREKERERRHSCRSANYQPKPIVASAEVTKSMPNTPARDGQNTASGHHASHTHTRAHTDTAIRSVTDWCEQRDKSASMSRTHHPNRRMTHAHVSTDSRQLKHPVAQAAQATPLLILTPAMHQCQTPLENLFS